MINNSNARVSFHVYLIFYALEQIVAGKRNENKPEEQDAT